LKHGRSLRESNHGHLPSTSGVPNVLSNGWHVMQ
jgi:hypothetical protein